ncbi:39S ribosomal protein L55, mitochondrial-like [Daphnia pulicaria]|uniref:39S ribosomal protein L55, mitochondrial-like n=1 Tax=Daphnia pulicaria TaxID=35523 RepID=UPI001EEA3D27|nr:39S ribosomal protein L55, mitochondrial-like [Daphnia pulicaria]
MTGVLFFHFTKSSASGTQQLVKMSRYLTKFRLAIPLVIQTRQLNAHRASIGSIGRSIYVRTYPTLLVQPDGSTITVQYNEPRAIIKLPLDFSTLSEAEKQKRLAQRKPKKKVKIEEEIEDTFDQDSYSHLWKK